MGDVREARCGDMVIRLDGRVPKLFGAGGDAEKRSHPLVSRIETNEGRKGALFVKVRHSKPSHGGIAFEIPAEHRPEAEPIIAAFEAAVLAGEAGG